MRTFQKRSRPILAIDPGSEESAFVHFDQGRLLEFGKVLNGELLYLLRTGVFGAVPTFIEMIASYGMPVGREVFETCVFIGRLVEASGGTPRMVYRKEVKIHLCNATQAKDSAIRAVLIGMYGGSKRAAIGLKNQPGPLYGVSGDVWSALAIAVTAWDTFCVAPR